MTAEWHEIVRQRAGVGTTDRNPARIRNEFMRGLGVSD
jgi:hypothetical protein